LLIKSDASSQAAPSTADLAIDVRGVSKAYTLYPGPAAQAADLLGLNRLMPWRRRKHPEYLALRDIDFSLARGERVAIIGRNGAGKTTLLKLISSMIAPTTGSVAVNGAVQALMQVGVGFHPDYSGIENIRASLLYTGLNASELKAAEEDIIEFCELGDFLGQPLKTYSLGMQARLQFACATAIKPEILIVDEILGAGDAYFSVKSNTRMQKLTKSGCTLLLVSHSMAQVLQFCERAVWIDGGRIVRAGEARSIVTEYEQFMFEKSKGLRSAQPLDKAPAAAVAAPTAQHEGQLAPDPALSAPAAPDSEIEDKVPSAPIVERSEAAEPPPGIVGVLKDIPDWHNEQIATDMAGGAAEPPPKPKSMKPIPAEIDDSYRWINDGRLRIVGAALLDSNGERRSTFYVDDPFSISITFEAQEKGTYDCWYVALIYMSDGKPMVRHVSSKLSYRLEKGERRNGTLTYDSLQIGRGEYHVSVAIYRKWAPDERASAHWYEILNRSLEFQILDRKPFDPSIFFHPARWTFPTGRR
jgi:lipopolysaccharide transport system ATP-binding protein